MIKLTKRMRFAQNKVNFAQYYKFVEAVQLLKSFSVASNFIESFDVAINLGIDARKSDQHVRGFVLLPHGTGRNIRVAVFTQNTNDIASAKDAGAVMVGMDDLAEQIKKGDIDIDVVIASPDAMHVVSKLGSILGPRGLMPNLKTGTVTHKIADTVKSVKMGQINYRNDKNGIIHTSIGRACFECEQIKDNLESLVISLKKVKPTQSKGIYIRKITLSTTMGVGIFIDKNSLDINMI